MVSTSLYTGLSGLRVHQSYIDVIGNNLANVSTPGFRGSRPTFSDVLSFTVRAGSGPNGDFGGLNPLQVGHGVYLSSIDTNTNQGTFQDTGRPLDVAMQGRGFFTLTNGLQQFYTRVGAFGVDASGMLVDVRSRLRVVGASGNSIRVPTSDTLPAQPTATVKFQGNLPATVSGPLAEILQSSAPMMAGTAANKQAAGNTGVGGNQFDLTAFAGGSVQIRVNGAAPQTITFPSVTFGGGPVPASTVAAAFSVAGLQVTADDVAGKIDFDTVKLGAGATLKFDDGANSTGLLAALGMTATLVSGTETAATRATDLAGMTARNAPYADGDRIVFSGTNADGSAFSDTFVYGVTRSGTTLGDLIDFINARVNTTQARAELTAEGHIRFAATNAGPAELSLFIGDAANDGRGNNWPSTGLIQDGTGPDTAITSIGVIDTQGRSHQVTMKFTRSAADPKVWDMAATMDPSEGTVVQGNVGQIRFNDNGSFNVIGGGSNTLTFRFDGIAATQSVAVNLGTSGQFDGIALLGETTTVAATDQDGFGAGTLLNVGFNDAGELVGNYTNGQSKTMDTLRISMFSNEAGLLRVGETMFVESPNSNDAIATTARAAGAGSVRAGSLENSNVDIASEFVNLIEAQRGFQANSRVITTTDEILAELMNIVR